MTKKEKLQAFIAQKQKDKKVNLKMGTLDTFNVGGLDSTIPTLHLPIDDLVGGIQRGTIMEIYGPESSGKSSSLGKIIENIKYFYPEGENFSVLYVDSEGTFNVKFFNRFRHLKEDDITFFKETIIEEMWETVEMLIEEDMLDFIVLDSIAALQTSAEDEKEISESSVGQLSRKVNTMINYLSSSAQCQ